ncbi:MAG: CTP-dependent riboflavin kinase [Desulfurococcales archaeon]|nr:CTP-dependent riboflavin kinase [Desulfurococcales archaeon]
MSMEEQCARGFPGQVFSGRGEGSFYVSIYAKMFRKALGFTPYPGTLNIRLAPKYVDVFNDCLRLVPKIIVNPPPVEGAKLARVVVYPLYVNGLPAYGVKPEITVYKGDVVEVISDKYLRETLRLRDGDTVYVSLAIGGLE